MANDEKHADGDGAHGQGATEHFIGEKCLVNEIRGDRQEHTKQESDSHPTLGRGPYFIEPQVKPEPEQTKGKGVAREQGDLHGDASDAPRLCLK